MKQLPVGQKVVWGHAHWCVGRIVECDGVLYTLEELLYNGSPTTSRIGKYRTQVPLDFPIPITEDTTPEQIAMIVELAYGATLQRNVRKDLGL